MRKQGLMRGLRPLTLALLGVVALSACTKSEPKKSNNEIINKLHEDPVKAVFTLTECSLDPDKELNYANRGLIMLGGEQQTMTYAQSKEAGFARTPESVTAFRVKTKDLVPSTVYHLSIKYYNANNQLMNNQFIDNAQDKIHQHFFTTYGDNGLIVRDVSKIPYQYIYADKDKSGQFFPESNPIGMEGFFRFSSGLGNSTINVELTHFFKSKYDETTGKASPYYAPDRKVKSISDADVSLSIAFEEIKG